MDVIDLQSWADFPKAVEEIRNKYGSRRVQLSDGRETHLENEVLFRGQSDAQWGLETTLDRWTSSTSNFSILQYFHRANLVANEIASYTGTDWKIPKYPEVENSLRRGDCYEPEMPCYEYFVYLRHHGFPSPLLDWSTSPYIAAFFAIEQQNNAERCSVFAFIERPNGHKINGSSTTNIRTMGRHITTHRRHFAQKAEYTIATKWDNLLKEYVFCSHESVPSSHLNVQDVLIKITIPRCDRVVALKQLEDYNINHFSLFQTEDSLIRSLASRAFDLDG